MTKEMERALENIHYHLMKNAVRWVKLNDRYYHGIAIGCSLSWDATAMTAGMDGDEREQIWEEYNAMLWGCED